jgi:hypothetical protein
MSYTVLTDEQARLLNKYTPWADKVDLAALMDEVLSCARLGIFDSVTTTYDIISGRDLYVTRDAYITRRLYVGGGYGSTGWTCDENGNTTQDGLADFSVGGLALPYGTPLSSASGTPGEMSYGIVGGNGYCYICFADGDWRRAGPFTAGY